MKAGLEFHDGRHLLATASGVHKGSHDGGVVAHPVQGLLDGNDGRIRGSGLDEVQHRGEAVVGVVQQNVTFAQTAEDVAVQLQGVSGLSGDLQGRTVHAVQGHEIRKGHGAAHGVDLEGLQAQLLDEELAQVGGHAVGCLQTDHIAEAALIDQILHGLEQIVGLVLFDFHVRVAGDAEAARRNHFVAREERGEVFLHHVFQKEDVRVAHVGNKAKLCVGFSFLGARHKDEARHVARAAHTGKVPVALLVAQLHEEVQAHIGDGGEGMGRVNGLGRQDRIDFIGEVVRQETALLFRKIGIAHKAQASFGQLMDELLAPVILTDAGHGHDAATDVGQLPGRTHAVRSRGSRAAAVLPEDVGHAHHEEFIKVVAEDAQEFELFQQGSGLVQGTFKHSGVEFQPVDFPVDVEARTVQVLEIRFRAGFQFRNFHTAGAGRLVFFSLVSLIGVLQLLIGSRSSLFCLGGFAVLGLAVLVTHGEILLIGRNGSRIRF